MVERIMRGGPFAFVDGAQVALLQQGGVGAQLRSVARVVCAAEIDDVKTKRFTDG
jgi:hypothetical protein